MELDLRDLGIRFVFGGTAVAACYILLQHLPSKSFAGVFAAFPAVMAAAVIMAGHFGSSEQASDIALGASADDRLCCLRAYGYFLYGTPESLGVYPWRSHLLPGFSVLMQQLH